MPINATAIAHHIACRRRTFATLDLRCHRSGDRLFAPDDPGACPDPSPTTAPAYVVPSPADVSSEAPIHPSPPSKDARLRCMTGVHIEQVDERDSNWEDGQPRFRVYVHGSGDSSTSGWTDTYDITGADVLQVIDWAQKQAGDALTYAVALVRDDDAQDHRDPGRGRGLVWLSAWTGTTPRPPPARPRRRNACFSVDGTRFGSPPPTRCHPTRPTRTATARGRANQIDLAPTRNSRTGCSGCDRSRRFVCRAERVARVATVAT